MGTFDATNDGTMVVQVTTPTTSSSASAAAAEALLFLQRQQKMPMTSTTTTTTTSNDTRKRKRGVVRFAGGDENDDQEHDDETSRWIPPQGNSSSSSSNNNNNKRRRCCGGGKIQTDGSGSGNNSNSNRVYEIESALHLLGGGDDDKTTKDAASSLLWVQSREILQTVQSMPSDLRACQAADPVHFPVYVKVLTQAYRACCGREEEVDYCYQKDNGNNNNHFEYTPQLAAFLGLTVGESRGLEHRVMAGMARERQEVRRKYVKGIVALHRRLVVSLQLPMLESSPRTRTVAAADIRRSSAGAPPSPDYCCGAEEDEILAAASRRASAGAVQFAALLGAADAVAAKAAEYYG